MQETESARHNLAFATTFAGSDSYLSEAAHRAKFSVVFVKPNTLAFRYGRHYPWIP